MRDLIETRKHQKLKHRLTNKEMHKPLVWQFPIYLFGIMFFYGFKYLDINLDPNFEYVNRVISYATWGLFLAVVFSIGSPNDKEYSRRALRGHQGYTFVGYLLATNNIGIYLSFFVYKSLGF